MLLNLKIFNLSEHRRDTTLWALTVRQPNLLDLVNCPPNVERSIRKHRHSEPLWGYTTALSQATSIL